MWVTFFVSLKCEKFNHSWRLFGNLFKARKIRGYTRSNKVIEMKNWFQVILLSSLVSSFSFSVYAEIDSDKKGALRLIVTDIEGVQTASEWQEKDIYAEVETDEFSIEPRRIDEVKAKLENCSYTMEGRARAQWLSETFDKAIEAHPSALALDKEAAKAVKALVSQEVNEQRAYLINELEFDETNIDELLKNLSPRKNHPLSVIRETVQIKAMSCQEVLQGEHKDGASRATLLEIIEELPIKAE